MYETEFPTGHGTINVHNQRVSWNCSADNPHKGLLKCVVEPPAKIDIPVLPMKFDERLLFPLCRRCAVRHPLGLKRENYECHHTAKERSWVATLTHIELNAGLDRGYKVTFLIRTLDYTSWSANIFKPYVEQFIRLKVHASGWPSNVETEQQKADFIDEYKRRNIIIDENQIEFNAGRRSIAKICNNSLWGRFSLRNQLSKTAITDDPVQFLKYLNDHRIEIKRVDQPSPNIMMLTYGRYQ